MSEQGEEDNKSKTPQYLKKKNIYILIWYLVLKKRKYFREGEGSPLFAFD